MFESLNSSKGDVTCEVSKFYKYLTYSRKKKEILKSTEMERHI